MLFEEGKGGEDVVDNVFVDGVLQVVKDDRLEVFSLEDLSEREEAIR